MNCKLDEIPFSSPETYPSDTGWTKSTLPILNPKYFKNIPGLPRAKNSEVAKSSPRGLCKITNNFEKYPQQMA